MDEIDREVYDFMKDMERKHKRRGSQVSYPERNTNIGPVLPSHPDKDRGNEIGWDRGARRINSAMAKTVKTHRILNRIATTLMLFFLILCAVSCVGIAIWNSLN